MPHTRRRARAGKTRIRAVVPIPASPATARSAVPAGDAGDRPVAASGSSTMAGPASGRSAWGSRPRPPRPLPLRWSCRDPAWDPGAAGARGVVASEGGGPHVEQQDDLVVDGALLRRRGDAVLLLERADR